MKKTLLSYTLLLILGFTAPPLFAKNNEKPTAYSNAAQSQLGFERINTTINKSPTDNALYQGIKLANGMEVLLISDEKANKSLMAVGLPVGSMEDPVLQQGLAHYLEHMILMGSKAFPETNSLDGFLTKNGGYNNAYTAPDRTVYFLEVNNNAFDEAVARLSDAFAQPLLDEKNAKKEVNAVHAEMVRAKSNDSFLMHDVNLATANPAHPITKFAVGNNLTLSDKADSKLQDELVKFYQQYYSANLMKAVLYSNQSIEQLAKLANQTLGKVENKQLHAPQVTEPFFRAEDKSVIVNYRPVKSQKMMVLSFDLPESKAAFKHKTGEYLAYIFNSNTAGTLSDYLIKQGLSDSGIQAEFSADVSRNRGDFSFYIELTDKGLAQREQIISLVFQQIEQVKLAGIQAHYFKELQESLNQSFQHLQVEKSGFYVAELVSQMLSYPLEHIIDQPYLITQMDEKAIQADLNAMTVDNVRVLVVSDNAQTDQKTRYFEAPYALQKISAQQKAAWLDFSRNPALKLPEANPYFATDFSLNPVDKARKIPLLIEQQEGTAIYAMPSQYFADEPKAKVALEFAITPQTQDLKAIISATLLGYMSDLAQMKITSQASVAGIQANLSVSENHLQLGVEGYTQHLPRLMHDMLQKFSQFELNEDTLAQAKQRYLEALTRQEQDNALRQAVQSLKNFANFPYFEVEKQKAMLEQIQLSDIAHTRATLLNQATGVKVLSVGNLSDSQLTQLVNQLETVAKNQNSVLSQEQYVDINQSQRKINYVKAIPHQDNALAVSFFPKDYAETDSLAQAMLLKDILSSWYFDDLRTDKQLGYAVHANIGKVGQTSGLQFFVQSPTASPETIMQYNQRFFAESLVKLQQMDQADFEKYRSSLVETLQHKPESLAEEFNYYHSDFVRGNNQFDRVQKGIEAVKALTLNEIIRFYQQTVIEPKGFVFVSQMIGTNPAINQAAKLQGYEDISNIEQLQKEFELKTYSTVR